MKRIAALILSVALSGCATARDTAVSVLNSAADFGNASESALEELDKREQEHAVNTAKTPADAKVAVAAVREKYHKAWDAYRAYRAAWLGAAATLRAYDDAVRAGKTVDPVALAKAVDDLVQAEADYALAVKDVSKAVAK